MYSIDQIRQYQVKQPDGSWVSAQFGQLEDGDVFRAVDHDGSVVVQPDGKTELRVLTQPYLVLDPDAGVPLAAVDSKEVQGRESKQQNFSYFLPLYVATLVLLAAIPILYVSGYLPCSK